MSLTQKVAATCGAAVLLLAGCGSKDDDNPNASDGSYEQGGPRSGPDASGGRMPGANGKVAAVDGNTAQVQGGDGQVAVSWDGTTTFTKDVSATLAAVKVGSCVIVGPAGEPSSSSTPATEITAASVRITPKTDGSCGIGLRGPGGPSGPVGPPGQGSAGEGPQLNGSPPPDAPKGGQRPQVRTMGGAIGEVTAVSASGFTVDSVMPVGPDSTDTEKTPVTVTVDGSTTYTTTDTGAAADVKVGVCMAATGTTDETGAVTAKTVNLSQPVEGQCGGPMRFTSSDGDGAETKVS